MQRWCLLLLRWAKELLLCPLSIRQGEVERLQRRQPQLGLRATVVQQQLGKYLDTLRGSILCR